MRARRLRDEELRAYEEFWRDWHAKYDRYATRNGQHKLNHMGSRGAVCICGARYYNAPEDVLLAAFQEHLDENEPPQVDLGM